MRRIVSALSKLNRWKQSYALFVLCATSAIALPAQTLTTIHSFNNTDGAYPFGTLLKTTNGDLYGTTWQGGANGDGTIFKISNGTLTTIYTFCSQSGCADGIRPYGGLVLGANGDLYGTASYGGANGFGTVFEITLGGSLTTLHSFNGADGAYPVAGLVLARNGNFYGTTANAGPNGSNQGTVFEMTPSGTLTTLYSFCSESGCTDGSHPNAALIQGTDGFLYGTTCGVGVEFQCNGSGPGTVFKMSLSGNLTTVYDFCSENGCADGEYPTASLVQVVTPSVSRSAVYPGGNYYSTAAQGGGHGYGTVFQMTPGGTHTTIYSFCSLINCTDGAYPASGLYQNSDGDLYGTTWGGGANVGGTVFKITSSGALTTIYNFCSQSGCADGANPFLGVLVKNTDGNLYGTTYNGGAGYGTVFSLSLAPGVGSAAGGH